mgnify:CR=1 FL=1
MQHFSPFEVGQVKAHLHHGLGPEAIAGIITKTDGKSHFSHTAVARIKAKLDSDPTWRGERQEGSGAVRKTTAKEDEAIVKEVIDHRGKWKVTVASLRRTLPVARKLKRTAIEERLYEAGLEYLRRRRKCLVAPEHLPARVVYCRNVLTKQQRTLDMWAYTDGTTFFLDRSAAENAETQRAALGPFVWKQADGSDAMWADCVGPSSYRKAQGIQVKVWGLLADGKLHITVLDHGENMDRWLYAELIEDWFPSRMGNCRFLVQDFETCLRCEEALLAFKTMGIELVEDYPPVSQDFNAIENCWKFLRERLDVTLPEGVEPRECFISRLKKAVAWLNRNRSAQLSKLSRNQKERAREALANKPRGSRTKW